MELFAAEHKTMLISAVDDGQRLNVNTCLTDAVTAVLETLFHSDTDTYQFCAGFFDDVAQAAHGFAIGHKVVHDQNLVIGTDPILGDQQGHLFLVSIGENVAGVQTTLDVVALRLFCKDQGDTEFFRTDGTQRNAAGFSRQNQGDIVAVKTTLELMRNLTPQLCIDTVVQKTVNFHNITGEDLTLFPNSLLEHFHSGEPPFLQYNVMRLLCKKKYEKATKKGKKFFPLRLLIFVHRAI